MSQITDDLVNSLRTETPLDWYNTINTADFPKAYEAPFAALTANVFFLMLPGWIASPFVNWLSRSVFGTTPPGSKKKLDVSDWLEKDYLPEILKATKHNKIPIE